VSVRICDPHVHLYPEGRKRSYGIDELRADTTDGHEIESVVYVEAANGFRADGPEALRPVGETEWVVQQDDAGLIAGIVGYADLRLGDAVEDVLEAQRLAGRGRFRGIRYRTNWDASRDVENSRFADRPGLLDDADVGRGVAALGRLGLTLDLFVYFHQLDEVERLARAHPGVTMIVDHYGTPVAIGPYAGRRNEVLAALRRGLEPLVGLPNVQLKLGGLGWPGHGFGWETWAEPPAAVEVAAAWSPLTAWCIDAFGPDRCMCESNYPSDRPSLPYRTIWDAQLLLTRDLAHHERAAVLHDTAVRVYRLDA
jgi:L-fuconolactonase